MAVKAHTPAALFEITLRHSAGRVGVRLLEWGRAQCDKLKSLTYGNVCMSS